MSCLRYYYDVTTFIYLLFLFWFAFSIRCTLLFSPLNTVSVSGLAVSFRALHCIPRLWGRTDPFIDFSEILHKKTIRFNIHWRYFWTFPLCVSPCLGAFVSHIS
ncbi:hypothetical protein BJX63DRAFT_380315 [Aspergillus granulosus]|uniref:Secreted protein n=1 Tax=Aspergillus granulosus TaxID=176169 RepID=A0ABR4I0F0_9EURO